MVDDDYTSIETPRPILADVSNRDTFAASAKGKSLEGAMGPPKKVSARNLLVVVVGGKRSRNLLPRHF